MEIIEKMKKEQTDWDEGSINSRSLQVEVPGDHIDRLPMTAELGRISLIFLEKGKKSTNCRIQVKKFLTPEPDLNAAMNSERE